MKPLVEIGFMPEALSITPAAVPAPLEARATDYNDIYTGWTYPPKDYDKWRRARLPVGRGTPSRSTASAEVESWCWEVWNEPNIGYWHGTPEEFHKLYDYAADGLKRALPTARIGGPDVTGPNGARTQEFLAASSSTACAARTTPPARSARRSTSSPSTPRARRA